MCGGRGTGFLTNIHHGFLAQGFPIARLWLVSPRDLSPPRRAPLCTRLQPGWNKPGELGSALQRGFSERSRIENTRGKRRVLLTNQI